MSEPDPKPLSPAVAAGIIFFVQLAGMLFMGMSGSLARFPQGFQFFFGLELVAFPLIVYVLLKKRQGGR